MASQATVSRERSSGAEPRACEWTEPIIERQIRRTSRQVKQSDLWGSLLGLAAMLLGYLLLGAVVDHWIAAEGLRFLGRMIFFAGLVCILAGFVAFRVAPAVLRPINPAYAAQTIEQAAPTLKNGLINLVLLKRQPDYRTEDPVERHLLAALEKHTAAQIARTGPEMAVDRAAVVRNGVLLVVAVAATSFYLILSPKSPLASFGRICWPWAPIPVPTRVTIDQLQPGHATVFQGDPVVVSAVIRGLRKGETPVLYYSTADGTQLHRPLPMEPAAGGYRHQGRLPPDDGGLQQTVEYYIAAGDCRTPRYRIEVQPALAITVERVEYDYPEYTALPERTAWRVGDIRAVEGTAVTIHAVANRPIRQAWIELDGQPTRRIAMRLSGQATASGKLVLGARPGEPGRHLCRFYQLRFTDTDGRENRQPVRYRVEAIPDQPPVVQLTLPGEANRREQVPRNGYLDLRIHAYDPDFGLRRVILRAECRGKPLHVGPLLERSAPSPPQTGPWETVYRFRPAVFRLRPQDRVTVWAEVLDSREPEPNRVQTAPRTIVISGTDPAWAGEHETGNSQAGRAPQDSRTGSQETTTTAGAGRESPPGVPEQQTGLAEQQQPPSGTATPQTTTGAQQPPQSTEGENPLNLESGLEESSDGPTAPQQRGSSSQGAGGQSSMQQQSDLQQQSTSGQSGGGQQQQHSGQSASDSGGQSGGAQSAGQQSSGAEGTSTGEKSTGGNQGGMQSGSSQATGSSGASNSPSSSNQGASAGRSGSGGAQSATSQAGRPPGAEPGSGGAAGNLQNARIEPVDPRTDPGEAFERILELLAERGVNLPQPGQPESSRGGQRSESFAQAAGTSTAEHHGAPSEPRSDASGNSQSGSRPGAAEAQHGEQAGQQGTADRQESSAAEPSGTGQTKGLSPESAAGASSASEPGTEGQSGQQSGTATGEQGPMDGSSNRADRGQGGDQSGHSGQGQQVSDAQNPQSKPAGTAGQSSSQAPSGDPLQSSQQSDSSQQAADRAAGKPSGSQGDSQEPASGQQVAGSSRQEQGKAGSGTRSDSSAAPPLPEGANQPRSMSSRPEEQASQQGAGEPPMSSRSARQSNSRGDGSGDRSGGGQKGGGQRAQQPGPGTAGSHAPADQGGSSTQQGPGDQTQSGNQMAADRATGTSSENRRGPGSRQRPGTEPSPGARSKASEQSAGAAAPHTRSRSQGPTPGGVASNPTAGGRAGPMTGSATDRTGVYQPEDANLQYARQATDLVLEQLADQLARNKPDRQLLDRLGWTAEDLRRFYEEWSRLKRQAEQPGQAGQQARRQLDRALDSLGLRPPGSVARPRSAAERRFGSLREAGRFEPPGEWADLFRAYRMGVARGNQ